MIVILGSEGGFPPKMSRRAWHNGSRVYRVYSKTRRRKGTLGRLSGCLGNFYNTIFGALQ
jgi:hypothetical protein